jgi:hypothetical protein
MAFMNTTLQDATDTAHSIQTLWMAGHLSRYDLVDRFIDNLLVDEDSITHLLDRLHVLVTTKKNGVAVEKASNSAHLKELLLKTTFMYVYDTVVNSLIGLTTCTTYMFVCFLLYIIVDPDHLSLVEAWATLETATTS